MCGNPVIMLITHMRHCVLIHLVKWRQSVHEIGKMKNHSQSLSVFSCIILLFPLLSISICLSSSFYPLLLPCEIDPGNHGPLVPEGDLCEDLCERVCRGLCESPPNLVLFSILTAK